MILVDSGSDDSRNYDGKLQFCRQLQSLGIPAGIDGSVLPEKMHSSLTYESVPFLFDPRTNGISQTLLIGAEEIGDQVLARLRRLRSNGLGPVTAIGRFSSSQSKIGTQSKLAYVLGYEPAMLDLNVLQPKPLLADSVAPLFAIPLPKERRAPSVTRLLLVLPKDLLEEPSTLPFLSMLDQLVDIECKIITAGVGKTQVRTSRYSTIPTFGFTELSPEILADMADMAIFYGPNLPGERMAAMALNLLRKEGVVIDCTASGALVETGAPVLRGPIDIGSLAPFLQGSVLVNHQSMGKEAASHNWLLNNSIEKLTNALSLTPIVAKPARKPRKPRVVFFPTNGVGLGHAQRCALIGTAMKKTTSVAFVAFPSCIPMLQSKGFDCLPLVQKSDQHLDSNANDLVNYLRLGQVCSPGDQLIFDGGYIFDSIYRTILERRLNAVWIRRGLFQPGQASQNPVERQSVFNKIIIPAEALEELNTDYSSGPKIHHVGPIVQRKDLSAKARVQLRTRLAKRFDPNFKQLIITMLGGGEAADRTAQMQSLCAQFASRPDCLHLMVVWPNAKVSAGLMGWKNSHVVRTQHAVELCQVADLVVSAAGYNSFNEVLYHAVPTIFIPQMSPFMDDQERRARAASERGAAATVLSTELLLLAREVEAFLDGGKAATVRRNLKSLVLQTPGTADAATLIEGEMEQ